MPTVLARSGLSLAGATGPEQRWKLRLGISLLVLAAFLFTATAGYRLIEKDCSWLDAFYMTVITVGTVGYSEVPGELSSWGRVWTMFVIAGGLVTGAVVLSLVVGMIVDGQVRRIFGRRQLERKIAALTGHVIVCGFGRMGSLVAEQLKAAGREVVVVEVDPQRTALVEQEGMLYLLGDAQEEAVLAAAGVARSRVLVAALTDDASNVFVTLSARQLNPEMRIVARAQDVGTQDKLIKAGATRVVCPQSIGANRMADVVLRPAVVDFVEMAHKGVDLEMDQLELGQQSHLVGRTLKELALPRRIGVHVVAVRRADGLAVYNPRSELELSAGDTLILIGERGVATAVQKLQVEVG